MQMMLSMTTVFDLIYGNLYYNWPTDAAALKTNKRKEYLESRYLSYLY